MMNIRPLMSTVLLSSLMLSPVTVLANPIGANVDVFCPNAQGAPNVVTNFGDYIAGYGAENILSQNVQVYFRSTTLPPDLPAQLSNYYNEATTYTSTTGRVTCSYLSNQPSEPRFVVGYTLTNGRGGSVQWQTGNSISIQFPVGFHG